MLKGQSAIVTGSTSGIGLAIASALAHAGAYGGSQPSVLREALAFLPPVDTFTARSTRPRPPSPTNSISL